jgi:hypothetical protein
MASGSKIFLNSPGQWQIDPLSRQLGAAGWAWGIALADFNNDSFPDVFLANGHMSRETTADYESEFWRHDIYVGSSEHDPIAEQYFQRKANDLAGISYGGFWKNAFFLNEGGTNFLEAGWLMGLAEEKDCRSVARADLNQDGRQDIVFTSFEHWPASRQKLHVYRNELKGGNWIAFQLEPLPGVPLEGAKAIVITNSGRKLAQWVLNGDSFRAQHPAVVHFGLGRETAVQSAEIIYPGGKRKLLKSPSVGMLHLIPGD